MDLDLSIFKKAKTNTENISSQESFNIWDTLRARYNSGESITFYSNFRFWNNFKYSFENHKKSNQKTGKNPDFKKILDIGQNALQNQLNTLEKKCSQYEIPVPQKPSTVQKTAVDPEIFTDKFAYRHILKGMQEAVDLHIRAVIETTRNDSLGKLFMDLLKSEFDMYNKMLKYGKAKGWTHVVPKKSL